MAPVKGKRPSIRTRTAKFNVSAAPTAAGSGSGSNSALGLPASKKDKRSIKHSAFVSKIEKASTKSKKRRRGPSKQLVANLESLADALPDTGAADGEIAVVGDARIEHRSLKSRPGATKRREKIERMERQRFGKNMAQMLPPEEPPAAPSSTPSASSLQSPPISNEDDVEGKQPAMGKRWGALRQFISQTMEQNPEFREKRATSKPIE